MVHDLKSQVETKKELLAIEDLADIYNSPVEQRKSEKVPGMNGLNLRTLQVREVGRLKASVEQKPGEIHPFKKRVTR